MSTENLDEKIYIEKKKKKDLEAKELVSEERVPYRPSLAYKAYFPNGTQIYINGIVINLVFDGRTYMLPKTIKDYVENKLESIIFKETKKEEMTKEELAELEESLKEFRK